MEMEYIQRIYPKLNIQVLILYTYLKFSFC